MENTVMKEFVEILKNEPNKAFDFLGNEGYQMSKSELIDIGKELLYGIYYEALHGLITMKDHDKILENAAENLEDCL